MTVNEQETKTEKVFLWTSAVYHELDRTLPMLPGEQEVRRPALCGTKPYWPGEWFDDKTPEGAAKIAELPFCGRCKLTKEAYPSVYGA